MSHGDYHLLLNQVTRSWTKQQYVVIIVVSLALFTDMVLYDAIVPILPKLLDRVGASESKLGILFTIYSIGYLLMTPLFGIWSDETKDRKTPMIIGQLGLIISTILFARAKTFSVLLWARFLQGCAAACTWTLGLALLAESFPSNEIGTTMGIAFAFNTFGCIIGPLLGGILCELYSIEMPFYICSVLVVIDLIGRIFINEPTRYSTQNKLPLMQLVKDRQVLNIAVVIILSSSSLSAVETLLADYLQKKYGFNSLKISLVMLAMVVSSTIFSILGGIWSDRYSNYTVLLVGFALYLIAPILISICKSIFYLVLAAIYFGATSSLMSTPALPELATVVSQLNCNCYAQIYAIANVCFSTGMLFGPLIASYIYDGTNFFMVNFIFSLMFAFYLPTLLFLRHRS